MTERDIVRCYDRVSNPFQSLQLSADYIKSIESTPNPMLTHTIEASNSIKDVPHNLVRDWKAPNEMSWKNSAKAIFKGLINEKKIIALYGQPGKGKSFIAIDMASCLSLGKDWGGYKYKGCRGGSMILASEGGGSFDASIDAVKLKNGLPLNVTLKKFPISVIAKQFNLFGDKNTGEAPDVDRLIANIKDFNTEACVPCRLLVIDTMASTFIGGDENTVKDMNVYLANIARIVTETGVTVMIVHHSGKDQNAGLRGSSALIGAVDSSFEIKRSAVGSKERFELIARKQKDDKEGAPVEFNRVTIKLGVDEDGDVVDSQHILLETDSEFESVIPNKIDELTLDEYSVYISIALSSCHNLNYKNGKLRQNNFSWSYYQQLYQMGFKDKLELSNYIRKYIPKNCNGKITNLRGIDLSSSAVTRNSWDTGIKRWGRIGGKLAGHGLVNKNQQKQYVTEIEDIEDIMGTNEMSH
jgi:hypothetical protein